MILVSPLTTEKAYGLASGANTYVFGVPVDANRQQITQAVEAEFGVRVVSVRTLVQNGKSVRYSRGKNRYPGTTTRQNTKKAYVTLAEGDSIAVFDGQAEQEAK